MIRGNSKEIEFTHAQLEVLYGTLLGDAWLNTATLTPGANARLCIEHSTKQQAYCEWKAAVLELNYYLRDRYDRRTGKTYHSIYAASKTSTTYTELRSAMYEGTHKRLIPQLLDNLGPLGLAVWYMDDGSTHYTNRLCTLCTERYTLREQQTIQAWFRSRWGLNPSIAEKPSNGTMKYCLVFDTIDSYRLIDIIKPYVTADLEYKTVFKPYKRPPQWFKDLHPTQEVSE